MLGGGELILSFYPQLSAGIYHTAAGRKLLVDVSDAGHPFHQVKSFARRIT